VAVKNGRGPSPTAARSVLDGREHGARIAQVGNSVPRPAASWFFPRSARAGQSRPGVGKAGHPAFTPGMALFGRQSGDTIWTVRVVDPNSTAWSLRVRRLAGRWRTTRGSSDGHPAVRLPIALAELGVRHIVHCPGSATSLNGEGKLDAF
jgi:hypothetical protein